MFPYTTLLVVLMLNSCINTEIVPEILQPKLSITPKSVSLTLGQTTRLDAVYVDEKNVERPELVQWKSNLPAIANNVEFLSPQAFLAYEFKNNFGVSTQIAGVLNGQNVLAAPSVSFGVYRKLN